MADGVVDVAPHIPLDVGGAVHWLMNRKMFTALYEAPVWRPMLSSLGSGLPAKYEVESVLGRVEGANPEVIVDMACGTGHYARALASTYPRASVLAVDVAPQMLKVCHSKARKQGLDGIVSIRGDVYKMPFGDQSVDLLNCTGALHLFSDLAPIWAEIHRVLKPSGIFTAMTIGMAPGPLRRVQKKLMADKKARFFVPEVLGPELEAAGLGSFDYDLNRVSLIFSARRL